MSKTKNSTSTTRTNASSHRQNYDECSDDGSSVSSNEDEISLPRSVKSKKMQPPTDAADSEDPYDRGGRRRKRGKRSRSRRGKRRSRSRSRRRR